MTKKVIKHKDIVHEDIVGDVYTETIDSVTSYYGPDEEYPFDMRENWGLFGSGRVFCYTDKAFAYCGDDGEKLIDLIEKAYPSVKEDFDVCRENVAEGFASDNYFEAEASKLVSESVLRFIRNYFRNKGDMEVTLVGWDPYQNNDS